MTWTSGRKEKLSNLSSLKFRSQRDILNHFRVLEGPATTTVLVRILQFSIIIDTILELIYNWIQSHNNHDFTESHFQLQFHENVSSWSPKAVSIKYKIPFPIFLHVANAKHDLKISTLS